MDAKKISLFVGKEKNSIRCVFWKQSFISSVSVVIIIVVVVDDFFVMQPEEGREGKMCVQREDEKNRARVAWQQQRISLALAR